eukprot:jgi/Chlat1/4944/Chrsp32S04940
MVVMPASAARLEDIVEGLSSLDTEARLKALRDVKNSIIGNKTKKISYIKLGAVPRVVEILASDTESSLLVQSAATVGSFACGIDDGVRAVLDSNVLPHLFKMLSSSDSKVMEAGVRSLKLIFQSSLAPKARVFEGTTMQLMMSLLNHQNDSIAEVAASVLARCCETTEQQEAIAAAGGLQGVFRLLASPVSRRPEAALDVLAALTRDKEAISRQVYEAQDAMDHIRRLLKDSHPRIRLLACTCVVNIDKAYKLAKLQGDVRVVVLPAIVKLLGEGSTIAEDALFLLAKLIEDNDSLQRLACGADAISRAATFLSQAASTRLKHGALCALSALCSSLEEARAQLVDNEEVWHQALPVIVSSLSNISEHVREAACNCVCSLSRSVQALRKGFSNVDCAPALLRLLEDGTSPTVQVAAAKAICNMVLDFAPMKKGVLAAGLPILVAHAHSMEPQLRVLSVKTIENLLFSSTVQVKEQVMAALTYPALLDLLQDPEEEAQEHAVAALRNLVFGQPEDVDRVLLFENGALLRVVERTLLSRRHEILLQSLYCICNIAAATEAAKEAVMASSVLESLPPLMADASAQIRVAAIWILINLSWREGCPPLAVSERVARLKYRGLDVKLAAMLDDPSLEVKDRVRIALEHFAAASERRSTDEEMQLTPLR